MMSYAEATNPPILPSRLLMQPPDDVWGNYSTTEDSWLATWHWPSGTKVSVGSGAAFYVLPFIGDDTAAALAQLGIHEEDAPLAMFSGLVAEQLKGHRDNEDVIKQGWEMVKKAYEDGAAGNLQGFTGDVVNASAGADDAHGRGGIPIMALDERNLSLHPSPDLFPAALDIVRSAYINGTSISEALATVRDTMAPNDQRIKNLVRVHEANEVIAAHSLAPVSVPLQVYATAHNMSVNDARKSMLSQAGALVTAAPLDLHAGQGAGLLAHANQPKPRGTITNLARAPHAFLGSAAPLMQLRDASSSPTTSSLPGGFIDLPGVGRVSKVGVGLTVAGAVAGALLVPSQRVLGAALGGVGGVVAATVGAAVVKKAQGA